MEESSERLPLDDVITRRLNEILEAADLSVTTTTAIRQQLEAEMGVNLTTKKAFIRQQIDIFLQQRRSEDEEEAEGEEEQQQDEDYEDEGRGESEVCQAPELDPALYESTENQEKEKKRAAKKEVEPDSNRFRAKIKRAIKDSMPKKKRGSGGGFQKVVKLSPELEAVIGESQTARTQVVKLLWNYIREHNLQNPEDKRKIKCDDALRKVFEVDEIGMFAMQKKLSQHLFPLNDAEAANAASNDDDNAENEDEEPKSKKPKSEKKGKGSAFTAPTRISPGLQKFLGTDEDEVSRQDVTKQLWGYIKSKQLQDPANKKMILCDSKLEELFDCKSFSGFGDMPKLLKPHFLTSDN